MIVLLIGLVLISAGVMTTVLAFSCRRGTLPLNAFAGIRIPSTTVDAETWVRAHRAAWRWIAIAGAGPVFSGVFFMIQREDSGLWPALGSLWLLAFIAAASVVASRAARSA